MPYGSQPKRRISYPTSRKQVVTQFLNSDLSPGVSTGYTEQTQPTQLADMDTVKEYSKLAMVCGCYWPDREIGGICSECSTTMANANVCKEHFCTCGECGLALCHRHSWKSKEDPTVRLCEDHHRKEKRKALLGKIAWVLGLIFFRQSEESDK